MPLSTRPRSFLLALLAAATCAGTALPRRALADEPVGFEGKRVRVLSTVPQGEELAKRAGEAAEATLLACEDGLPYRLPEGERLVVHIYGFPQEYKSALKSEPVAAQNLSATLLSTKESYLLVQPRPEVSFLDLVGDLPDALRFTLCRECVRQFLVRAGAPGYPWWPDWYAEGIADSYAWRSLEGSVGKDDPRPIFLDDRRHRARDEQERGRSLRLDRALHAWHGEAVDRGPLYAQWDEIYRLLASEPERLKALHARIRDLKEPAVPQGAEPDTRTAHYDRACADALAAAYGPLDALDARLRAQVAAETPAWFEPLHSVQRAGDEIVVAARPDSAAFAVRVEPAPKEPFVVSFEMQVLGLPGGDKQAEFYLAFENRTDPRFLKVVLPASGAIALQAFALGSWQQRLSTTPSFVSREWAGVLASGGWMPVRIEASASRILLDIKGKRLLETDVPPGFDMLGNEVGLGSFNEAVRYRKFEVAPTKERK